ncbi:MAG TPA: TatD family hydrolase [Galbitalea sp.]|jgi:TatD DNase family protein|nr:TatD family hydrolase [Galbitalea sp.]
MTDDDWPPLPEALIVPIYDNHTHLEPPPEGEFDGREPWQSTLDYHDALDRASSVGVRGVVQVGTDLESSRWSAAIAAVEPRVLAAVALHPNEAPVLDRAGTLDNQLAEISELAGRPRVRAIGETGLDFFRTGEDGQDAQRRSFEAHIQIAKEHGLALQIHDRDAHRDVVETLLRVGAPERTVFHCFSGDAELASILSEHGWYASFAGTVTFKNAPTLRDALEALPRRLVLVETDSPFLTPVPFRGRPNSSYLIPYTLRAMAAHLGTDVSMLAALISSNTEEVYGGWNSEPIVVPDNPTGD